EGPTQPWSLAGALAALKDSGAGRSRALAIFSTGAEGTTITPEDLADQAVAADVPLYPVALWALPWALAYEGYQYDFFFSLDGRDVGQGRSMWGPAGPYLWIFGPEGWAPPRGAPPFAPYINYPFEVLGE